MSGKYLVLVMVCLVPWTTIAGELSITVTDSEAVYTIIRLDMETWANNPTDVTGCGGGVCCVAPATDEECITLAQNFTSSSRFHTTKLYPCIADDNDWACHVEVVSDQLLMYCEVIPATKAVRMVDIATCASERAHPG